MLVLKQMEQFSTPAINLISPIIGATKPYDRILVQFAANNNVGKKSLKWMLVQVAVEQPCPSAVGTGPDGLFQSRFLRYNLILKQIESKIKRNLDTNNRRT